MLDLIVKQVQCPEGFYKGMAYSKPNIEMPVIYEDDHVAIGKKNFL